MLSPRQGMMPYVHELAFIKEPDASLSILQAAYAAGSDQPDARQRLVAAIHSIAGREVIMDFYDREGQAQGGSAGSSAGLEHGVDDRTVCRTACGSGTSTCSARVWVMVGSSTLHIVLP